MNHEFLQPGKVLFTQGTIGDKFYIILSGKVGVLIRL